MEVKKSDKASLKGMSSLYLLTGIVLVLALVWGLLQYKRAIKDKPEVVRAQVEYVPDAIVVEIPEDVTPPPPPPPDAPPPPPPPPIPEEIEVVDDTEELPEPDPEPVKIEKPRVVTGPVMPSAKPTTAKLPTKQPEKKEKRETVKRVTARQVTKMAIYPGCEREASGGKNALIQCFSKKLGQDIADELYDFAEIAQDNDIDKAAAKLRFVVGVDGYIKEIEAVQGGNEATAVLNPEAVKALERVSAYLKRKGKLITPAELNDGEKAELDFSVPVRFVMQ